MDQASRRACNANRWAFLAAGFGIAAWAPVIPYIQNRFALSEHELGLLLLCVGLGGISALPAVGTLAVRFGCRAVVRGSCILMALCLIGVTLASHLLLAAVLAFLIGHCSVVLDVASNINAAAVEKMAGKSIMSGLHGLFSVGGLLGAGGLTLLLTLNLPLTTAAVIAALILIFCGMYGGRYLLTELEHAPREKSKSRRLPLPHPVILLIGCMCFLMFLCEGGMLDWTAVYLHQERGMRIELAGYGYAAFAMMMLSVRLCGDRLVGYCGRDRIILGGAVLILIAFILAACLPYAWAAMICFGLVGLGSGNIVPQLISYAASRPEMPMHVSVTWVNAVGFMGTLSGPALIGMAAAKITLPITFIGVGCGVMAVGITAFMLLRKSRPD